MSLVGHKETIMFVFMHEYVSNSLCETAVVLLMVNLFSLVI